MGVWIETIIALRNALAAQKSHPSWVCGLKLQLLGYGNFPEQVTPFVGVWIETPIG